MTLGHFIFLRVLSAAPLTREIKSTTLTLIAKLTILKLKKRAEEDQLSPSAEPSDIRLSVPMFANSFTDTTFHQSFHHPSNFKDAFDSLKKLRDAFTRSLKGFTKRGSIARKVNPNQKRHDVWHHAILDRRWNECDWVGMANTNQNVQAFNEGVYDFSQIHGGPPMGEGSTLTANLVVLLFRSGLWGLPKGRDLGLLS